MLKTLVFHSIILNSLFVNFEIWEEILKKNKCSILNHFKYLADPRKGSNKMYALLDIIGLTICAVIAGADTWNEIEKYGKYHYEWLSDYLLLPNGIPSHDTIRRFFSLLNPEDFEKCFLNWINSIRKLSNDEIISLDGKTLRHSFDSKSAKKAIHIVSAWAASNNIVLGQRKICEKSNEITAIPELLKILAIKNCIITIDAMGCQKDIVDTIIDKDADYILAIKGNQGNLYNAIKRFFNKDYITGFDGYSFFESPEENKHGRSDQRKIYTYICNENTFKNNVNEGWTNLNTIIRVESQRLIKGELKTENRYYISSLKNNAEEFSNKIRTHWFIENKLHWSLDISFREDECRKRYKNSGENFAKLRRIALNILKNDKSEKIGIASKRKMAGWGCGYMKKLLGLNC